MKQQTSIEQNFIVDKLTDSILNTISGDSFLTEVSILTKSDLKNITKKNGWNFDWKSEFNDLKKEVIGRSGEKFSWLYVQDFIPKKDFKAI